MMIRAMLALALMLTVSACDTAVPPPAAGGEGFGAASLHFFLSDSTGAHRASGFTDYVRLDPGDVVTDGFTLFVRLGDGTEAEVEGDLTAVCTEAGALTYTLAPDAGPVWRLETRCDPVTAEGTWVRLDEGDPTEGGAFETGIAIP